MTKEFDQAIALDDEKDAAAERRAATPVSHQFEVMATVDNENVDYPWLEASSGTVESLDEAVAIVRKWWADGEVEQLKIGGVVGRFTIVVASANTNGDCAACGESIDPVHESAEQLGVQMVHTLCNTSEQSGGKR